MGGRRAQRADRQPKNDNNKICQKISPKKSKSVKKISPKKSKSVKKSWKKIPKCKKVQNLPGLPGNGKSVAPSHIVRFYPRLTSTKSVLRLTCTRLARAEILTFLVGLVERRVKKRKSSAFEAEFKFEVGQSVGSLRSPPSPKNSPDLPFTIRPKLLGLTRSRPV